MSDFYIRRWLLPFAAAIVVTTLACGGEDDASSAPAPAPPAPAALVAPPGVELPKQIGPKQWDSAPPMLIDPSKRYTAIIEMEKGGEIVIDLHADKAPKTVNSFVFLARQSFYDGLTFHKLTFDFATEGGDPTGTGTGGPGYFIEDELLPDLRHGSQGVVSMDNDGVPDTGGSRFIIVTAGGPGMSDSPQQKAHREGSGGTSFATSFMDGFNADGSPKNCADPEVACHTVFGLVVKGINTVKFISPRDPETATSPGDAIKTIRIEEGD